MLTAKARVSVWRRKTNAKLWYKTQEVAAATKSWVGMYYCQDPSGSHCSLTLPRDTWPGASSPGRAHNPPQTVATSCRTLTKWEQTPDTPAVDFIFLSPAWWSKWDLLSCYLGSPAGLQGNRHSEGGLQEEADPNQNWSNRAVWIKGN